MSNEKNPQAREDEARAGQFADNGRRGQDVVGARGRGREKKKDETDAESQEKHML